MAFFNTIQQNETLSFLSLIPSICMQLFAITLSFIVECNFPEGQEVVFNFFVKQVA